ncbi:hypothetical protein JIX56_22755 [Streptomyces sp. CA-210063]|uniref:hypothetical protein n=1 Tax=Streptomyces sp. CA-210063 TaxID=2801029 RepID=UPI00214AA67F|nr:hypothetical protein [Streptomyces sp. CA-210063]UUU32495.1 hypothetical protein JIX56_22755 [Streptomyces sp. CA-210063]
MNHPTAGTDATGAGGEDAADATGQRLREAFTEAAYDVTPPPVPLEAIERDGRRRRRRRRAAALSTGCGLVLAPLVVLALRPDGPSSTVLPMAPPSPVPSASASPSPTPTSATSTPPAPKARVVAPDERVTTEEGTQLWLTADGKHWRDPAPEPGVTSPDEFRSLVDGNLDTGEPGITMQGSGSATAGYTVHGLFYGVRSPAARVEVTTYDGEVIDGMVLRLKGNTSWGVWYSHVKVPEKLARSLDFQDPVHEVRVYDTDGKVLAKMGFGP